MNAVDTAEQEEEAMEGCREAILPALARIETILRFANQRAVEEVLPKEWTKGRRRRILEFCAEPRTQQEIRDHIRGIAGYEVKQYLAEAVERGIVRQSGTGRGATYVTLLAPFPQLREQRT
jgi:chromosome segregation and condensation protein ScpB